MGYTQVKVGDITIGRGKPLALIAGPCVIESAESALEPCRKNKRDNRQVRHAVHF